MRWTRRAVFCVAVAVGLCPGGSGPAYAQALTVERLAALPALSGTGPVNLVWSRDGRRLAFHWNDQALPFRDLWVVSAAGDGLKRITDMARASPESDEPDRDPNLALAQRVDARARSGLARTPHCCVPSNPARDAPAWTPDSRALVFAYRGALFRVGADGSNLTRLTPFGADKYAVGLSPDGTYLSFLQDGDLWLWNQKTDGLVQATHWAAPPTAGVIVDAEFSRPDAEFMSYAWSPDSRRIALHFEDRRAVRTIVIPNYLGEETRAVPMRRDYTGDNTGVRRIAILSVAEGRLRPVDSPGRNERTINGYSWSPDGRRLLIDESSMNARHRWLHVVTPDDESVSQVWHSVRESRNSVAAASAWRSDGQGLVFVADLDGREQLYTVDLNSGAPRQLTRGDWDVVGESGGASLRVSGATHQIFFISTQKNPYERQVYRMPESGGPITQVTTLTGTHQPLVSPDGSRMALLSSEDVTPRELYIVDAAGGQPERRITHSPPKEFSAIRWVRPRYVTFKSHVDGVTLHGRLLEPPDLDSSKKYAVILGPVYPNSVRNRWGEREEWRGVYSSLQQYLVLEGRYLVFQVDVRGSFGYGVAFRERLTEYGGIDIEDLQSGVEFLKTLPYVDPQRIGIWGSSYGGLMTVMSLFKKPGVYKAGVATSPATNVWHALDGQERTVGRPNARPDLYRSSSAISYGEQLQDHLMIIHGMQDTIVLFKDSVTLAEKLMMLGKPFDFVVAPSATHSWSRKDYVATYLLNKLVEHFDRYLGRGPRSAVSSASR